MGYRAVAVFLALFVMSPWVAVAQNGYSFLNAAESTVRYGEAVGAPVMPCSTLRSMTTFNYSVVSARLIPADGAVPEHCRVSGVIPPEIRFELNLPTPWNGRFYMHGNGGYAGTPPEDLKRQFLSNRPLEHGFATAYTDTGHDNRVEPLGTFAHDNLQKEVDYSFRAVHLTVVTAKELIEAYFGEKPHYSYWDGCSTGGRQGLMSAQRFPEDFDGIVAGAPVLDFTSTVVWYVWINLAMAEAPIPRSKLTLVAEAVYKLCDGLDGLEDGLIDDPRDCDFEPARDLPVCGDNLADGCLTAGEIRTLEKIYGGPVHDWERLTPGLPVGAEVQSTTERKNNGWDYWIVPVEGPTVQFLFMDTFLKYLAFPEDDPGYDWRTFDFGKDPERMSGISEMLDATDPDLRPFRDRGGKILSYFGWADAALNPLMEVEYYEEVQGLMGTDVEGFFRLFMVPGMFHCRGGVGTDVIDAMTPLIEWVESGVPPDRIVAAQMDGGELTRTRPLCPYPRVARHDGAGDRDEASSFVCVEPDMAAAAGR
jgi:feruloyl esterase